MVEPRTVFPGKMRQHGVRAGGRRIGHAVRARRSLAAEDLFLVWPDLSTKYYYYPYISASLLLPPGRQAGRQTGGRRAGQEAVLREEEGRSAPGTGTTETLPSIHTDQGLRACAYLARHLCRRLRPLARARPLCAALYRERDDRRTDGRECCAGQSGWWRHFTPECTQHEHRIHRPERAERRPRTE